MTQENQILIELLNEVENWSDIKPRFEQFNTSQTDKSKKKTLAGKIFEVFAKYYFHTDPKKTELYEQVWLYEEIPLEIRRRLRLPSVDHGIDLLLQDINENFIAVQCKFKNDESKSLSWSGDKIANVFALGTNCHKIMVFTNVSDITSVAKSFEHKFELFASNDLYDIEPDIFKNILTQAKGYQPKELAKFTPKEHQETAIRKVVQHFNNNDRGQLILPCGAGKSLTALWIKEEVKPKITLLLVPSLALLKQIKNDWARHKNLFYRYVCVCSEKDIDKGKTDSITTHTYEIGGPVTTNPIEIEAFLSKPGEKVVFSTYQSIGVVSEACSQINDFEFDIVFCDEAHRTAGSKNKNTFTLVHDNSKIPAKKRLYMTATPKVISTQMKTRLGEDYELLCDMSNSEIFGEEAFRMSFGQAIDEGILVDYKIVGIGVTDRQIQKFIEERNYIGDLTVKDIADNFALDLVMNKYEAFHGISFHSRVQLAKEFAHRHKSFFEKVFSESVNGKQSTTHRARVLRDFKNSEVGLVSNARCLTEGVDVPTIDLIYFCDPKTSKIDIVQASGRALRTDPTGKKKMGFIIVPLFHHIEENVEAELKRKPIFNHLIQVIRSLCDQDERLQAEINNIAFKKGKRNTSRIEIDISDDDTEKIVKLHGLEKRVREVLFDEIIEKTRVFWDVMFKQLVEYKENNGHTNVSRLQEGMKQLGNWVLEQRRQYHNGNLKPDKRKKLEELGFDWKGENRRELKDFDDIWWESYMKLTDYFNKNGHSNVPARHKKDPALGTWVVAQRARRKKDELSQDRIDLLDEIDFNWNPKVRIFEEFCKKLIEFKEKYGHTNIPIVSKDFPKLGKWTNKYRSLLNHGELQSDGSIKYLGSYLTKKQIDRLNELGFKKSVRKIRWEDYYEELKKYYKEQGNSRPIQSEYPQLYYWCYRIRKNQHQLTDEQRNLLKELDFDFSFEHKYGRTGSNQNWLERFTELQLFFEENDHFDITPENEDFEGLYRWLVYQRRLYNNNTLSKDKLKKLQSIGLDFSVHFLPSNETDWEDRFSELETYYEKHQTFHIPVKDKDNQGLLLWLRYQRKLFREEKLDKEKKNRLLALGYSFTHTYRGVSSRASSKKSIKQDALWDAKFEQLKEYYEKYNTFLIPKSNEKYKHLIPWIQYQKKRYKDNALDESKLTRLISLGFSFDLNYRGKRIELELNPELRDKTDSSSADITWNENFERLKKYYNQFGTFRIPSDDLDLRSLRSWLQYQKQLHNNGKLTSDKKDKLLSIGYSFNLDFRGRKPANGNNTWARNFEEFKSFYAKYNTFLIPKSLSHYDHLKKWIQEQKRLYKGGRLEKNKLDLLTDIGYSFEIDYRGKKFDNERYPELKNKPSPTKNDSWEKNYLRLLDYKIKNGDCNVPRSFEDRTLANFVSRQRYLFKKGELEHEKAEKLKFLEFEFYPKKSNSGAWDKHYEALKEFYTKKGHSTYQKRFGNETLYHWVLAQRVYKRKGKLSEQRIKKLNQIKFDWEPENKGTSPDDDQWLEMLIQLKAYQKKFGHANVSQVDPNPDYKRLGKWLNEQRGYKKGRKIGNKRFYLSKEREELLNEIGVVWDMKEHEWNLKLELLKEFFKKHGDFNVRQSDKEFQGLYNWLFRIRKKGTTEERAGKLAAIGFDISEVEISENGESNASQSHTLAGRSKQPTSQNQPKSVPALPGKEIFKNAPRSTKKKDDDSNSDGQLRIF